MKARGKAQLHLFITHFTVYYTCLAFFPRIVLYGQVFNITKSHTIIGPQIMDKACHGMLDNYLTALLYHTIFHS